MARQEAAEIQVTRRVRRVQQQRMRPNAQFRTDDGFDARRLSRLNEFHDAMQVARVRQRDCGQAMSLRQFHNGGWRQR